jgi:hypothetical protein
VTYFGPGVHELPLVDPEVWGGDAGACMNNGPLFNLSLKHQRFTKTGSGQTYRKLNKRGCFTLTQARAASHSRATARSTSRRVRCCLVVSGSTTLRM